MNSSAFPLVRLPWLGLAAAIVLCTGCESIDSALHRETPREELTGTIDNVAAEVAEANGRIDETTRQLNELLDHPAVDLQRQFTGYKESLERLEASNERLTGLSEELQRKGREYLIEWDREIATIRNDELRDGALERKSEVGKRLDALYTQFARVRDRLAPALRRLNEVESALSVDLTAAGVQNVRPNAGDLDDVGNPARESLNELSDELRDAAQALAARGRHVPVED